MTHPKPTIIKGEEIFRPLVPTFALGKPSNSTTLKMSVNGTDWEDCDQEVDPTKFVNIVKDMPAGLLYKLDGNTNEVELMC